MQALAAPDTIAFGPFVLDLGARALLAGGQRLALSSRAFDILALLVTEHDRVVSKDEILQKVWRGVAVEENNLAVQMSSLRRVLGEHAGGQTLILTVPGQGYRFVARLEAPAAPAADFLVPETVPVAPPAPTPAPRPRRPMAMRLVAACGIAACAGLGWFVFGGMKTAEAPRLSIAVLPFRNLGDDRKQDYLADAITDDLTTDLSHLPGSVVIARESSDVYKGRAVPAQRIGHELNVRYLLEGSLRDVEGIFHVNAQLIDARNGTHLGAWQFDVPRNQLSDAQGAIVRSIDSALDVRLVAIEGERSRREHQDNPDALDLYLQARSIHDAGRSLDQLREAQRLLEKALQLQPDFVEVSADLALLLMEEAYEHDDPTEGADVARAKELIDRALAIEPTNVNALTAKGQEQNIEGKLNESEATLQTALGLDPNNLLALAYLARDEWRLGKPQNAADIDDRILRLDPQGAEARRRLTNLGMCYFLLGHYQNAVETLLHSLAGDTMESSAGLDRIEFSNMFLIAAYDQLGNRQEAQKLYRAYDRQWPRRTIWRLLTEYFTKAQNQLAGFAKLREGLLDAGMPECEGQLEASTMESDVATDSDFLLPPKPPEGVRLIGLPEFVHQMEQHPPPIVLDVGHGAATVAGSVWMLFPGNKSGGLNDWLVQVPRRATITVMGASYYGQSAYSVASQVARSGHGPVEVFVGGEEALACGHYPTVDRRVP